MKRRHFLAVPTVAASVSALPKPSDAVEQKKVRARQSVMGWCFKPMSPAALAKHAKAIGLEASGIPASSYPEVTELGLKISLVGSHGFATGRSPEVMQR